jgi:hypothetical protein
MAVDIKIEGLTVAQKTALMARLLIYYGPPPTVPGVKPEDPPTPQYTPKQWVTLCLWREIKNKWKSIISREKDAELRAAQDAVDAELGDEVA